jgi:hypothetical protein
MMQALKWASVEYDRSWKGVEEASNSPDAPKELAPLKGKTDDQMKAGWFKWQVQGFSALPGKGALAGL